VLAEAVGAPVALGTAEAVVVARADGVLVNCEVADAVPVIVDVGIAVIAPVGLGALVGVAGHPCSTDAIAAISSLIVTMPSRFASPAGHRLVPDSVSAISTSVMTSAMVTVPFPSQSPAHKASAL
jgi:hypothetical protein